MTAETENQEIVNCDYSLLVVGMGNPGKKYASTRHNIGWMCGGEICRKYKVDPDLHHPLCYLADFEIGGSRLLVAFPITYMNKSGDAVAWVAKRHNVPVDRIMIIVDEYNFSTGKVHLKKGGSDGGHNGTASVIEKLGSTDFWRLRCGIGKNFPPGMLVEYVLSGFYKEEIEARDIMIQNSVKAVEHVLKQGFPRAMSDINSGRLFEA